MTLQPGEQQREYPNSKDSETVAIKALIEVKHTYQINYNQITDDDVLFDAMDAADTPELQRILMRYRKVKNEVNTRDPQYTQRLISNYFSCIRKIGLLQKKGGMSWLGKWDARFVVLTNAGFVYFTSEKLQTEDDLKPHKFKPLNDFVVHKVEPNVSQICGNSFRRLMVGSSVSEWYSTKTSLLKQT